MRQADHGNNAKVGFNLIAHVLQAAVCQNAVWNHNCEITVFFEKVAALFDKQYFGFLAFTVLYAAVFGIQPRHIAHAEAIGGKIGLLVLFDGTAKGRIGDDEVKVVVFEA